jgi:hypothetical protein
VIDPLPAVALEVSSVFPPAQNEAVPVMFAEGKVFAVTTKATDVKEQPLLLVIVTVYEPAATAVKLAAVAPLIGVPPKFQR